MTPDQWVQTLTFSSALVSAVAAFLVALPSVSDSTKLIIGAAVTLIVTLIDAGLGIFFKVRKPINTALMTPPPAETNVQYPSSK